MAFFFRGLNRRIAFGLAPWALQTDEGQRSLRQAVVVRQAARQEGAANFQVSFFDLHGISPKKVRGQWVYVKGCCATRIQSMLDVPGVEPVVFMCANTGAMKAVGNAWVAVALATSSEDRKVATPRLFT